MKWWGWLRGGGRGQPGSLLLIDGVGAHEVPGAVEGQGEGAAGGEAVGRFAGKEGEIIGGSAAGVDKQERAHEGMVINTLAGERWDGFPGLGGDVDAAAIGGIGPVVIGALEAAIVDGAVAKVGAEVGAAGVEDGDGAGGRAEGDEAAFGEIAGERAFGEVRARWQKKCQPGGSVGKSSGEGAWSAGGE